MDKPLQSHVDLSHFLGARREQILERWTRRIGAQHLEKHLTGSELRDHLPAFFDDLVDKLSEAENTDQSPEEVAAHSVSAGHGTQRLRVGFDLLAVLREYQLLRECIFDEIVKFHTSVSLDALRLLLLLLDKSRAEALHAYVTDREAELKRTQSQHVAFIAHELRTPLMNAFSATGVLRSGANLPDGNALALLERNLRILRELTDQVLLADRLSSRTSLRIEPVDLRQLLDEVAHDVESIATGRGITLDVWAPASLPYRGDRRLLRSALGNVLGNAIKFTHADGQVWVRAGQTDEIVYVETEDRCGGLPEGSAKELFQPFVQRGENRSGFGLGLAIVAQAIETHGGRVEVRNLPRTGCVFRVELPRAK